MTIVSSVSSVLAISQDEITLTLNWSSSTYYQGNSGSVTISLQSTSGDELEFTWVGIHFPWMLQNYYYTLDLSGNPKKMPSGGSITFSSIGFDVPSSATIGWNEYYIRLQFNEHHWYGWMSETWTSSTNLVYIHDAYEKTYNQLTTEVSNKITDAQYSNFQSADAKSFLQQAQTSYNLAISLASQGKWQDATSHLQDASTLADKAVAAEQTYQQQQKQQFAGAPLGIVGLVIGGLALIIIIIAIAVVMTRRKSKPENPNTLPQIPPNLSFLL